MVSTKTKPKDEALVKVSGNVFQMPEFINWIYKLSLEFRVIVCVGGGAQINKEFIKRGLCTGKFGPFGREIRKNSEEYRVARGILEDNKKKLEELLKKAGTRDVIVEIPMLNIGKCFRHVNGDQYIFTAYLSFDKLYIATLEKRFEEKMRKFAHLSKIEIVAF